MKATGTVDWIKNGTHPKVWRVALTWMPGDMGVMERNRVFLDTAYYATASKAKQVAESYAKALGMEIEWEEVRR